MSAGWPLKLTASALTDFSQYARSPGRRAHCHARLAVSSQTGGETVASTACTYAWKDGQAEWAWMVDPPKVGSPIPVRTGLDVALL